MSPAVAVCGWCKLTSDLDPLAYLGNSNWSSSMQISQNFKCSGYTSSWPKMTFDLALRPLTAWTYEGSHIVSINQVWYSGSNRISNFSNEATFTFSARLLHSLDLFYFPSLNFPSPKVMAIIVVIFPIGDGTINNYNTQNLIQRSFNSEFAVSRVKHQDCWNSHPWWPLPLTAPHKWC